MIRAPGRWVAVVAVVLAAGGCGASASRPAAAPPPTLPSTASTAAGTPSPAAPRSPAHHPSVRHTPAPAPTVRTVPRPRRATAAAPPPALIYRLRGVGTAHEVISATSDGYGTTTATVQLWQKRPDGSWTSVGGPWPANIGYNGFSSDKHEGDGTTPVGSYSFGTGFGVQSDPGYRGGWIHVDRYDVWVDDPASAYYNTHQRDPANGRWQHAEAMDQPGVYDYAAVIDYNTNPVRPGAGSAIFLHVSPGGPTAGCVALPLPDLLTTLRWLDPAEAPRIIMGPLSAVT